MALSTVGEMSDCQVSLHSDGVCVKQNLWIRIFLKRFKNWIKISRNAAETKKVFRNEVVIENIKKLYIYLTHITICIYIFYSDSTIKCKLICRLVYF